MATSETAEEPVVLGDDGLRRLVETLFRRISSGHNGIRPTAKAVVFRGIEIPAGSDVFFPAAITRRADYAIVYAGKTGASITIKGNRITVKRAPRP